VAQRVDNLLLRTASIQASFYRRGMLIWRWWSVCQ